jgi:hypothetical protein
MWKLYQNPLTSRAGIIKCDVIITANCYAFIRDLHLLNVETNVLGPTNISTFINCMFVGRMDNLSVVNLNTLHVTGRFYEGSVKDMTSVVATIGHAV